MALSLVGEGIRVVVGSNVPELVHQCRQNQIPLFRNLWLKNETHRRWMFAYYLLMPLLIGQYCYVILKHRVDVVMLGSRDDQIFATFAAKLLRRKVVWIDHADMKGITSQPFRFLKTSYYKALSLANRVVAVSRSEQAIIFQNLPKSVWAKFVVINNGATRQSSTPKERPKKSFVVSYIGRIERDKGIYDLMEAIDVVVKKQPGVVFWLAGKGQAMDDLIQHVAAKNLSENVQLLGHVDNVFNLLDASDLFVYPSHHDASPLAPVEALLAGLPVVATNIGGIPEVLNARCSLLVEKQQPNQLAAAILQLVQDPEQYNKLKTEAAKQGKRLEFKAVVKRDYLPLLREVIAS